ncbi:MAG TPA: glycine oxidase ThiO [Terriglobales bacterium]|nr:glycine oxidase ThiO [Terriglobales bacterium]
MKSWDAIVIGGGIIGLSLAISLRKEGLKVLVVERGELGREASWAAAGMLAASGTEFPETLKPLAAESARMYPEFVHELQDESGINVDLRDQGTILISHEGNFPAAAKPLTLDELSSLEPSVSASLLREFMQARAPMVSTGGAAFPGSNIAGRLAAYLDERCVDPRILVSAVIKAARHRGVDIASGTVVEELLVSGDCATGVRTEKSSYCAGTVINCAGAWAGCVSPVKFPVRPIKGQMLAVVGGANLRHVVRGDDVYLVPRSDGRIVIGSTLENAGYDKRVEVNTIQKLVHAALELIPALAKSKKHENWAGLRPGTPDGLPILGETSTRGYFVATGHYRDGILLAPITARVMTDLILRRPLSHDLATFFPARFMGTNYHGDTESRREAI